MRETFALRVLDADDAVLVRLALRHRRDGDMVAAVLVVGLDHLREARLAAVVQHVGEQQRERLVADDIARAPHGVPETERRLLAREARRAGSGKLAAASSASSFVLPRSASVALELRLEVEMILDRRLVAPRHEDEMLDPGGTRLVDHMLDHRAIDDGQHFLRHRLGRRQEACAEARHGEHGLADTLLRGGHGELRA